MIPSNLALLSQSGPLCLTLSGNLLDPELLLETVQPSLLANSYRGVAVNWLPQAAQLSVEQIATQLSADLAPLAPHSVVLLGHSAGGVIAQICAAQKIPALRGVILVNTGACMINHGEASGSFFSDSPWGIELIEAFLTRCHHLAISNEHHKKMLSYALTCTPEQVRNASQTLRQIDTRALLSSIAVPTLLVHGMQDNARTIAHAQELLLGIPKATLHLVDCGHTPPLELNQEFNTLLNAFLNSLA